MPKRQGADAASLVRDLELPNEDAKVLACLFVKILDRRVSEQLRQRQQAFVFGGQIERNVIGRSEAVALARRDPSSLRDLLFLDCTKGFNALSWEWAQAVFQQARVPPALAHGIFQLMHNHTAYL
eukprot:2535983-Pyramimonas_sp.AAC.1